MDAHKIGRRLDKLVRSLNPRQAIVLAIDNAIARFNSMTECGDWLAQNQTEHLLGDPREVLADFAKRLKKEKPAALLKSIVSELSGRAVLAQLWLDCNHYLDEVTARQLSRLALISQHNSQVLDQIEMQLSLREAWKIIAAQPCPLGSEDAAAIEAAIIHQVQGWETLLGCDLFDWLSEGKAADQTQATIAAFEAAVHSLIQAGEVKAGVAVELGPIPLECLLLMPLVDGQWIDRYVVELAEFGAILEAGGFTLRVSAGSHRLAPLEICQTGEDGKLVAADEIVIAQLRQQAAAAVAGFTGRTREIDGRLYLHIDDYRAWAERKLPGDLKVVAGIVVRSWNDWVDRQGGEGQAELAGTKVRHLIALADRCDFTVGSDPDELLRQRRQRQTINQLTRRPPDCSYRDQIVGLLLDLFEAEFTITTIKDRWFDGHQILFKELQNKLRDQLDAASELADSYNRLLDLGGAPNQTAGGAGTLPSKIEIDEIRRAAEAGSQMIVAAFREKAESGPRDAIKSSEHARRMANPILKQLESYFG